MAHCAMPLLIHHRIAGVLAGPSLIAESNGVPHHRTVKAQSAIDAANGPAMFTAMI